MLGCLSCGIFAVELFLLINFLTRIAIAVFALFLQQVNFSEAIIAIVLASFYDLFPASYIFFSVSILVFIIPGFIQRFLHRLYISHLLWTLYITGLLFVCVSEILFWDEFSSRFNFIAVDYLVYTHEVLHNIMESYPVFWLLAVMIFAAFCIMLLFARCYRKKISLMKKIATLLLFLSAVVFDFFGFYYGGFFENRYANELVLNGSYQFVEAFKNNTLDYAQHYLTVDINDAISRVRESLGLPKYHDQRDPISRNVKNYNMKKFNIVLIMVESLSDEFLKNEGVTSYLRSLYNESVYFANHYATGTRTVRGLEAFTLSVPPTPGSSIVRRPDNGDLYTFGSVLRDAGYETLFAYGGIGYFDNMNAFFQGNGYDILDQNTIPSEKIHFSNAWGVADEILFDEVILKADQYASSGKPFFVHVMTTSNHRPFTFPEHQEVSMEQGSRLAAVQYTDYAIARFINAAKLKGWFKDTIFIITADHCASSAGKTVIDVEKYHIPWIIYAPHILQPKRIESRSSQIDMAPTVLGLLNISYDSHFFGLDKLRYFKDSIITLGTYQNLGFFKNDDLVVLSPKKQVDCYKHNKPILCDNALVQEAIAWYQLASYRYSNGLMKMDVK